jgi:hypothetical protein
MTYYCHFFRSTILHLAVIINYLSGGAALGGSTAAARPLGRGAARRPAAAPPGLDLGPLGSIWAWKGQIWCACSRRSMEMLRLRTVRTAARGSTAARSWELHEPPGLGRVRGAWYAPVAVSDLSPQVAWRLRPPAWLLSRLS